MDTLNPVPQYIATKLLSLLPAIEKVAGLNVPMNDVIRVDGLQCSEHSLHILLHLANGYITDVIL